MFTAQVAMSFANGFPQQLILTSQDNNHKINIDLRVLFRKLLRNNDNPVTKMYIAADTEISVFLYVDM